MQHVAPTALIVISYILAIVFGRKLMKNSKPFELRTFMFVYNFVQVVLCAYITYEVIRSKRRTDYETSVANSRRQMFGFANDIVLSVNPWITPIDEMPFE